ncbi:MAG: hypothetical protein IJS68_03460 [Clostridia bacterium]|nr:hypothetical protein [Clostridia bacterium]
MKGKHFLFALLVALTLPSILLVGCAQCQHKFATIWEYDATYHWHPAICEHTDEVFGDQGEHSFVASYAEESGTHYYVETCSVCGYEKRTALAEGSTVAIAATGYPNLNSAINSVQTDQTIFVLQNFTQGALTQINDDKSFEINLNDKTITAGDTYLIKQYSGFVLISNGKIAGTGGLFVGGGSLECHGVNIETTGSALVAHDSAIIRMEDDCVIKSTGEDALVADGGAGKYPFITLEHSAIQSPSNSAVCVGEASLIIKHTTLTGNKSLTLKKDAVIDHCNIDIFSSTFNGGYSFEATGIKIRTADMMRLLSKFNETDFDGKTVTLEEDIVVSSTDVINDGIISDMNGHTITVV